MLLALVRRTRSSAACCCWGLGGTEGGSGLLAMLLQLLLAVRMLGGPCAPTAAWLGQLPSELLLLRPARCAP
jgi:hypothetical protein